MITSFNPQAVIATITRRLGLGYLLKRLNGNDHLTVLCYHRIAELTPDFAEYRANVSATPAMFERQMEYMAQHFNVIDQATFEAWLLENKPLPARPALITFDDGYLDNYTLAYPILRRLQLPAIMFLMTAFVGTSRLPWWDTISLLIHNSQRTTADLPYVGPTALATLEQKIHATDQFVAQVKYRPNERETLIQQLAEAVDVPMPSASEPRYFAWHQAHELIQNRITCQSHTHTHPILALLESDALDAELGDSKRIIEANTNGSVSSIAYPNGTKRDYSAAVIESVQRAGYRYGFTTNAGPMKLDALRQRPFEIERVYLSYRDTFDLFVMKVLGLPKIKAMLCR